MNPKCCDVCQKLFLCDEIEGGFMYLRGEQVGYYEEPFDADDVEVVECLACYDKSMETLCD